VIGAGSSLPFVIIDRRLHYLALYFGMAAFAITMSGSRGSVRANAPFGKVAEGNGVCMPRPRKPASPFRCFNSSPEVIRLVVMMYALASFDRLVRGVSEFSDQFVGFLRGSLDRLAQGHKLSYVVLSRTTENARARLARVYAAVQYIAIC